MALWVFGYGSLLWNPGFEPAEQVRAVLHDYHRSFCMLSIHHRGTEEDPGLVLALDPDDAHVCRGIAFRVPDAEADATLTALRERELISSAYVERHVPLDLDDGRRVDAVAYIVDTAHEQYRASLSLEDQANIIAHAHGGRGPNSEYLWNTSSHLDELGIEDADLQWLSNRVKSILNA